MIDPADFPVIQKWPAARPNVIQVYGFATANSAKIVAGLEEFGLDYDLNFLPFGPDGIGSDEFATLSPNRKMPAIIDPNGPDGPIGIFESGAILLYLAEKQGQLLPKDMAGRQRVIQWLMWQMAGVGPIFGQIGYFHVFAGKEITDPRPKARFVDETRRLLGVLEAALETQDWVAGEFSIADIAIAPWLRSLDFYGAKELVGWNEFKIANAYFDRFFARPAVQRAEAKMVGLMP